MLEEFWNEWREGGIHVRDYLQFELKSEFIINPTLKKNVYKQELFLFIPSPLQINKDTYEKEQFYLDQTNLIRYKTPTMSLKELIHPSFLLSPLNRIKTLIASSETINNEIEIIDELKLFGNIFKAALRDRFFHISDSLDKMQTKDKGLFTSAIDALCLEIKEVSALFRSIQDENTSLFSPQLKRHFRYTDEYISDGIEEYGIILLQQLRTNEKELQISEKILCDLLVQEKDYRHMHTLEPKTTGENSNEAILYRQGLLNRFMLEALKLNSFRSSLEDKHGNILGAVAAGIAMFVYMMLLFWNTSGFVINSFPFIMFAVFFYILKDRLKEGLKKIYYKQAYRWFPDYSTNILTPKNFKIGHLTENFAIIEQQQLPPGFLEIRNHHFHEELQALNRHETILQYKQEVTLYRQPETLESRRRELTMIFRLNIHYFLLKASNALQPYLTLDPKTKELTERLLPKVYHLNIIIKNSYLQSSLVPKSEIKKFRVVIDKAGIKRVEEIR
jgi:hypothetical protein